MRPSPWRLIRAYLLGNKLIINQHYRNTREEPRSCRRMSFDKSCSIKHRKDYNKWIGLFWVKSWIHRLQHIWINYSINKSNTSWSIKLIMEPMPIMTNYRCSWWMTKAKQLQRWWNWTKPGPRSSSKSSEPKSIASKPTWRGHWITHLIHNTFPAFTTTPIDPIATTAAIYPQETGKYPKKPNTKTTYN